MLLLLLFLLKKTKKNVDALRHGWLNSNKMSTQRVAHFSIMRPKQASQDVKDWLFFLTGQKRKREKQQSDRQEASYFLSFIFSMSKKKQQSRTTTSFSQNPREKNSQPPLTKNKKQKKTHRTATQRTATHRNATQRNANRTTTTTISSLAAFAAAALAAVLLVATSLTLTSAQTYGAPIAGLVQAVPGGDRLVPCPPQGFDSLPNFNLTSYISAPWYIQQQVRAEREREKKMFFSFFPFLSIFLKKKLINNEKTSSSPKSKSKIKIYKKTPLPPSPPQIPLVYQPVNQLYCVRAIYKPRDPANFNKGINVYNTANEGNVTGPVVGSIPEASNTNSNNPFSNGGIVAYPQTHTKNATTAASKLRVLPTFFEGAYKLNPFFPGISGPYWVVAASPDSTAPADAWSVISGGPPKTPSNGACRTGREGPQTFFDVNGSGLWIFTRQPVPPSQATVEAARSAAEALGYDLTPLVPVTQAGCTYPAVP